MPNPAGRAIAAAPLEQFDRKVDFPMLTPALQQGG